MSDSQLNVLLLSGDFEVRGSSAYTLRLAEHLTAYDVKPRVICPDARMVGADKLADLPITVYGQMNFPVLRRLVMELIRRDLLSDVPDLIHIQSRNVLWQGAWLARRLRRPFVLTVHDSLQPREHLTLNRRWGERIITVSDSVKAELIGHTNMSEDRVTVIHSGVESSAENGLRVLDPNHVPVVGTAGPLEAVKGLPFFLGAAQRVLAAHKDVEFLVSGAGPEEGNLRRLARDLEISEHVTFVPNLHDFGASIAAMDIFCLPSLRQGLGTIMLEAMLLGKPVIASGVGGVYSVVRDRETGLVVPPSDSEQLAQKILELLNDPVKARAMAESGQRFVQEEFSVANMVSQTVDVYRQVVEQSAAGVRTGQAADENHVESET